MVIVRPTAPSPMTAAEFAAGVAPLLPELRRAARRYATTPHDADDLLQETLTRAWAGRGTFDSGAHLRAWLFRILVNTWISGHRRVERRPREALTETFDDVAAAVLPTQPSAEFQAMRRLPDERLRAALASLPETLRTAMYYAAIEELPYRDIADLEGIPVGTVMSRVHRARLRLRAALAVA